MCRSQGGAALSRAAASPKRRSKPACRGRPIVAAPAAAAEGCSAGQVPSYVFGFADLKAHIGAAMGDPVTCEFPDPNWTGDIHQRTTTGLAFWRKATNTPTFTDGWRHWGRTPAGWVEWTGSSIDPVAGETPAAGQAGDVGRGPEAGYWLRTADYTDVVQTTGQVAVRVLWAGVTDLARLPAGVRANLTALPADASSLVGLRLRIENGSDQPGTLRGLNFEMPLYAPETTLDSNAGPLRVRDVGDAESRADVAAGTFRIYDLVFFSSSPSSSLRTFILVTPRLRGYSVGSDRYGRLPPRVQVA